MFISSGSTPALLPTTAAVSSLKKAGATTTASGTTTSVANPSTNAIHHVLIHPLVIFSILDHQSRRPENTSRVIGTLLGQKTSSHTIEISNCFAVPHAERGEEVAIGKDFNRQMLALQLRASNRKEAVVGWYATALEDPKSGTFQGICDTSALIHDFYTGECAEDPVHLVIDTSLRSDGIIVKAYISTPVMVKGEALGNVFHEVQLTVKMSDSERICLHRMISSPDAQKTTIEDENTTLQHSIERLHEMLENASAYVGQVVDGSVTPDVKVGRQLADTLSSIPAIRKDLFDKVFNDTLQDLMMVSYLSNLTRTQLSIAEKLNALLTS